MGKLKTRLPQSQYFAYIKSPEWQAVRKRFWRWAMKNNKNYCYACMTTGIPLDLHHKTYERLGCELLTDFCLLCRDCHRTLHERFVAARATPARRQIRLDTMTYKLITTRRKNHFRKALKDRRLAKKMAKRSFRKDEKSLAAS